MNPLLKRISRKSQVVLGRTGKELAEAPAHSKIGLGLGVTSLTLGVSNYKNNQAKLDTDKKRAELESKSLAALNRIHKVLAAPKKSTD